MKRFASAAVAAAALLLVAPAASSAGGCPPGDREEKSYRYDVAFSQSRMDVADFSDSAGFPGQQTSTAEVRASYENVELQVRRCRGSYFKFRARQLADSASAQYRVDDTRVSTDPDPPEHFRRPCTWTDASTSATTDLPLRVRGTARREPEFWVVLVDNFSDDALYRQVYATYFEDSFERACQGRLQNYGGLDGRNGALEFATGIFQWDPGASVATADSGANVPRGMKKLAAGESTTLRLPETQSTERNVVSAWATAFEFKRRR